MRVTVCLALLPLLAACAAPRDGGPVDPAAAPAGYADTPRLPDGWRVHDIERPVPPAASAGDTRDLLRPAPPGALVLFDGSSLDAWAAEDGGPARWELVDGSMRVNGTGSLRTRAALGDGELHLEWRVPDPPRGDSQASGNSGVFLLGLYEVQILDSWRNRTYADGQAAALYGQRPPDRNASRPPGAWQSFDISFRAPRFAPDGALLQPARVSVRHNGVLVHDDVAFLGATRHREVAAYAAHAPEAPLQLQDHGDPVSFRNVWFLPLAAD